MLRIGPAPPIKEHPSACLYLQQLRWDNGEILQGTKALDLLRLEMIPLSRQLVIGYVSYVRVAEEEKSATMDMRITMSYNTLRSAKVSWPLVLISRSQLIRYDCRWKSFA